MGLFNRGPDKADLKSRELAIRESTLRQKETALNAITSMSNKIQSKMQSFKSFPDEFYPSGIKQGKYAGLQLANNPDLSRRLSRMAYDQSPVAQEVVVTFDTLTVGHGLDLEAQPLWLLIDSVSSWTDEKKKEWQRITEARYGLWAKRRSVSYEKNENRYQQEQRIFHDLLVDGEYFELYRYTATSKKNPMSIQIIRAEDVRTPSGSMVAQGNSEENGIEYDSKGEAVAYHIYDHRTLNTVRVLKSGARSGRVFVNHVKLGNNRRGVGIISNMITELMKLGDYEVLELQAAVVNALYAIWVETPEGETGMPTLNGGLASAGKGGNSATQSTVSAEDWLNDRKELDYNQGGMVVDAMPGGYKVQSHDTKRPNVNFGGFIDAVKKNLSASKGMPISVLDKQFKNNYSASRGELILAWYEIEKYRFNQSMTNDLVYKMWMWGEVQNGKIEAPGFGTDEDVTDAWCNAKWIGNQRPDIDPLKSVQAHMFEQNRGYRTGKQIAAERGGGDYDENLNRVKGELAQVAENQVPFAEVDVDLEDN